MQTRATTWAGLVWLILISAATPVWSQPWQVAGDGTHVWVLRTAGDGQSFVLQHRARGAVDQWDRPDASLRRVDGFSGRVLPGAMAAAPGQLWLIFDDMSVEMLRVELDPDRSDSWRYGLARQVPLPRGASLRAMTAASNGLWVLLRVETAEALRQIDSPSAVGNELSGVVVPRHVLPRAVLPPHLRKEPTPTPPAEAEPAAPTTDPLADGAEDAQTGPGDPIVAYRLMWLHNERWQKVDLPEDWPPDTRAWLVFGESHAPRPTMVTTLPPSSGHDAARGERLRVYRWHRGAWQATEYVTGGDADGAAPDAATSGGELQALGVAGGLVLGRRAEAAGRVAVQLSMLAPEGVVPIGRVALEGEPPLRWAIAPFGDSLAVLFKPVGPSSNKRLRWTRMDLHGRIVEEPSELVERKQRAYEAVTGHVLLIGALVIATLIMFVFWRRDPQWNQLDLPETLVLADPARRALAAAIDLAPCLFIASLVFDGVGIQGMLSHWPMWSRGTWASMAPAGLAIVLFVIYTTLAELFTARTIGKAMLSLRVSGLRGEPPNLWQVLTRNLMKGLELVQPILLILPLIGPFRQRLGDLVARTVIAAPRRAEDAPRDDEDDTGGGDGGDGGG